MKLHAQTDRFNLGPRAAILGLILGALAVLGIGAASAEAAPLQPELTAKPSNPNTTHGVATFAYKKAEGDPAAVGRFRCRVYPTDTPPANPTAGFAACGGNAVTSASKTYSLANDEYTFEVQAGASTVDFGPSTSFTWTQNVADPTVAPQITSSPPALDEDSLKATFAFTGGTGEENIPAKFQCRLDGAPWSACDSGTVSYSSYGNGDHIFEVQAGGASGVWSPTASYEWELAYPNPGVNYKIENLNTTRWDSDIAGAQMGGVLLGGASTRGVGDVNGDGRDDIAYLNEGSRSVYVMFGQKQPLGRQSVLEMSPQQGYTISFPPLVATNSFEMMPVGDQNGDGRGDIGVVYRSNTTNPAQYVATVVYGVEHPEDLPKCSPSGHQRCLDLAGLTDDQGFRLFSSVDSGDVRNINTIGDWDGDGIEDFWFGQVSPTIIVKGGARTGAVDVSTLPSSETTTLDSGSLTGPSGMFLEGSLGDINGDGKDDTYFLGEPYSAGGVWVYYGRGFNPDSSDPLVVEPISPADGFLLATPILAFTVPTNVGDLNDDSRPDLLTNVFSLAALQGGSFATDITALYTPETPIADPLLIGDDLEPGQGYLMRDRSESAFGGGMIAPLGDVNGDGTPDFAAGAINAASDGRNVGAAYVVFGKKSPPAGGLFGLDTDLTPDNGLSISGRAGGSTALGAGFGAVNIPLGDLDGDGIPEFATNSPVDSYNGLNQAGAMWIVYGKTLFSNGRTADASEVTDRSAMVNAAIMPNGQNAEVVFEYGTTDEYGRATTSLEVDASGGAEVRSAAIEGLEPSTTYHYRVTVTNEKGLTRYGADRTFTTGAKPQPPKEGCEADATLPGCPKYDYCKANPTVAACKAPVAKLSGLIVSVGATKVKRGKKTTANASIVNTGTAAANGLKVCLSAPKKLVSGARCVKAGKLGAGATKTVKFKVKVKKKAKKGKKATLSFKASASGLGSKTRKVKIKVG